MNRDLLLQTLQETRFLHGFPSVHLEQIADIAQFRTFKKNDVVFDEGQKADNLYLVVTGSVMLEVCGAETGSKHILTLGNGELLGWSSLTDEPRYAAKAVAVEPLQTIQIDGARMRAICDSDPRFGYQFLRRAMSAISKRLTSTWKQLAEVYVPHYVSVGMGTGAQNE